MDSAVAVTYELDDMPIATDELLCQIHQRISMKKHSIAILYAQPGVDMDILAELLSKELGFPVMGGTTAGASLISSEGYHELAIMLQVLTADDCLFSVAISEELKDDLELRIIATYQQALEALLAQDAKAEPKLVYFISSLPPGHASECLVNGLSKAGRDAPLFGSLAGDDFQFSEQQVFLNSVCGKDRVVVLLLSGNVKPLFEVMKLEAAERLSRTKITKSNHNIISEINGRPAIEYLQGFSFIDDETTMLWNYQFFVELESEVGVPGITMTRALQSLDKETGEISCFGDVPTDSYISLEYCNDQNVKDSCDQAIDEVLEKLQDKSEDDYSYSTAFVISGVSRELFLASEKDAEGVLISQKMPAGLAVAGMYGFGEIAPTVEKNGRPVSCFHNAAIVFCVL